MGGQPSSHLTVIGRQRLDAQINITDSSNVAAFLDNLALPSSWASIPFETPVTIYNETQ